MEQRTLIERLARHLASRDSGDRWQHFVEEAASLLALLKTPDDGMREVGDERIWEAMIDAALRQRWVVAPGAEAEEPPAGTSAGTDEEGEIALPPGSVSGNRADWVHLHRPEEKRP